MVRRVLLYRQEPELQEVLKNLSLTEGKYQTEAQINNYE
jgi:hypothetical protein